MKEVLTIATVLGLAGVASSFLLFFLLEEFDVPRHLIQAIIFLKLDLAGHSTVYVTRSRRRHFWERPYPSWKLLVPALGTRLVGTLVACYGLFMPAIGWDWVAFLYLYTMVWFVFNDYIKVWTYALVDRRASHLETSLLHQGRTRRAPSTHARRANLVVACRCVGAHAAKRALPLRRGSSGR